MLSAGLLKVVSLSVTLTENQDIIKTQSVFRDIYIALLSPISRMFLGILTASVGVYKDCIVIRCFFEMS